jgi:hypothetical protein
MKNKKNMEGKFKENKNGEVSCMIKGKWVMESDYDYSKGEINEKIDKCMELILELNELKEKDFNGFEMSKFENFCYNVRDLKMFE